MSNRKNPFPGVGNRPTIDRHGKKRWRLRRTVKGNKIDAYLPGVYGSAEFRTAYHAAINPTPEAPTTVGEPGTFEFLITHYRGSKAFQEGLASTTRYAKGKRLDWIRALIGKGRYAEMKQHHIENMMDRKGGPDAANRLLKELHELYGYAERKLGYNGHVPTAAVDPRKIKTDGFHTWTVDEVQKFRDHHPSGTKARLAFELILATGAARQDACMMGRANIKGTSIYYRRHKTGQDVELPLEYLPELEAELRQIPLNQQVFIPQRDGSTYTIESFGNWFAEICDEAGLPDNCRAHGLRKHGAVRLAERGANEFQIMSFLAHRTTREALRYIRQANRKTMAAAGLRLLRADDLPNLHDGLGNPAPQVIGNK